MVKVERGVRNTFRRQCATILVCIYAGVQMQTGGGLTLPTTIGTTLLTESFDYSDYGYSGTIPTEVGLLTQITQFKLGTNFLTGVIPTEIGLMTSVVKNFEVDGNSLDGKLPTEIGGMTALTSYVYVFENRLNGTFPSEIGSLTGLTRTLMGYTNSFSGQFPSEIGSLSLFGMGLRFDENSLRGQLPTEFGNLTAFTTDFDLKKNWGLTGTIPTEFGEWTSMKLKFRLEENSLSKKIPTQFGRLTGMAHYFDLNKNPISGSIPTQIGMMSLMTYRMQMGSNLLTGEIPSELGQMTLLTDGLEIYSNELCGTLPAELQELSASGVTNWLISTGNSLGTPCCEVLPDDYTCAPTSVPTLVPTSAPTSLPTSLPSLAPSKSPSLAPTALPSSMPSHVPTPGPSGTPKPSTPPTLAPSSQPSLTPTSTPTHTPTLLPTYSPTPAPTLTPTAVPSRMPTISPKPTGLPTPSPSEVVVWGSNCSYSMDKQSRYVDLIKGAVDTVTTIPINKKKVFIEVDADSDLDLKLSAADGTVLLEYNPSVHWSLSEKITFSYHGIGFESCVDGCSASKTLVYHDNTTFVLTGSASYNSEWLYINETSEELLLEIEAYETGAGTVYWLWDCPEECGGVCDGVEAKSAPPTILPTGHPTLSTAPTAVPTLAPSPAPSVSPQPTISLKPTYSVQPTFLPTTPRPSVNPSFRPSTGRPTVKPTASPAAVVPPTAQPTTAPVALGARRSVTDCSVTDEDVIAPFFGSVVAALVIGALLGFCILRKVKPNSKVTPTIVAHAHHDDSSSSEDDGDDDERKEGDGSGGKDNAGGIRPAGRASGADMFKLAMAKKVAHKMKTLHELKVKQKQQEEQLAERIRQEKLDEMEELPFDIDGDEHGLVHELASLKDLHDREMHALHGLYDLKRAAEFEHQERVFGEKRDLIIKRNEEAGMDPTDELQELEQERDAARAEIEQMLGKLERDATNAEIIRQNQQTKTATGDGSAYDDEVRWLKDRMERDQQELLQARQEEQKRRQQALRERLKKKQLRVRTDMQKAGAPPEEIALAMTSLEEEGNREVATFELECAQANNDLLMKERQREIIALGEIIDPSEEAEWLKRQHKDAVDALDKTFEAEGARRRAKLAERMARRKAAKKESMLAAGVDEGSEELDGAMREIDAHETAALEELEAQMQKEADFYSGQLEERLQSTEVRHRKFNDDVRSLQEEERRKRLELEDALREDHKAKTAALMERLRAKRNKKTHEILDKDPPVSAEEISRELELLNESDMQELFDLQQSMQTEVATKVTESGLAQKAEIEKLVSTDAAVAAVMDFDNAELRRLVEKHAKDRADLEDAMQAKQRSSSAALKMRLAEKRARKKQQLKADGASAKDTAAAMVQLDHEDVEALDQLEAEVAQGFEEQWQKVTELGEQQVTDAASGSKEAAGEIEANLGELRQKHDEAMAQLDKELDAKRKDRQAKLAERLKKKRAKQEKKRDTLSEADTSKLELELIEEESNELADIEQELGEEKRELQLQQKREADERVAQLNEVRTKEAAEKAAAAAAAREQAMQDAAAIKATHEAEMKALNKQLQGEQKKKQKTLKDRLAKRRSKRAQELSKTTGQSTDKIKAMIDQEEKTELEKLALQEAERAAEAIDSKLKEHAAKEESVAMRVMAANNNMEAEAAAKRTGEMFKKMLGKSDFDQEQESRHVQEMLTQQQQHAERFQLDVERELRHHHSSLSDRVKRRRQRRESKAQQKQDTLRDRLREKQTSDLRELHATFVSSGNQDGANAAAREETQVLTDALEDAKHDRDQLREKVAILGAKLDGYEGFGGEAKEAELDEANLQIENLHGECDKLQAQNSESQAKLRESAKRIEQLEQEVTEMEMNAKDSTGVDSEEVQALMKDKELEIEDLTRDNQSRKKRAEELQEQVEALQKAAGEGEAEMQRLRDLAKRGEEAEAAEEAQAAAEAAAAAAEAKRDEMFSDLRKEQVIRKKLHNELEDIKGAVRVFARGRPLSASERDGGYANCIDYLNPTSLSIMDEFTRGKDGPDGKQFVFDSVFDPSNTQEDVFEDSKQLLESVLDGYNVCIFAYGQTGSGKTWTMTGTPEQPGITPRCITRLFERVEEMKKFNTITVTCYFVELYNDTLVDLLLRVKDKKAKPTKLDIKLNKHKQVYVKGAVQMTASSAEELQNLFEQANKNRHVSSTAMNSESSRSHSIFGVVVENLNNATKKTTFGKLSLIDLAGSERASKTHANKEQLREATSINQSLAALGNVIAALTEGDDFIPYRNNKLTLLMQDSLGGNAKTLMFVNFSPADYNADETNGSLGYGTRVKSIKNNAVVGSDGRETAKLKAKVRHLQEQLADARGDADGGGGRGGGAASSSSSGSESSESENQSAGGASSGGPTGHSHGSGEDSDGE